MLLKKSKAVIAGILTAAMATNALAAGVITANAAGTRTKKEAFGDSTYAERFLSLYDDVVTNGVENGYLSSKNSGQGGFGVPFHAAEEFIIEAPDYGHETTSEAMSYLVWVAAMHDNLATKTGKGSAGDLAKAWSTLEVLVPDVQDNFWTAGSVSAQYCGEYDTPDQCPEAWAGEADHTASNPIYSYFTSVYNGKGGKGGLYLMHWLGDVENWYGYGEGTNFTFINTFQRGEQESCFETVPHPCVEELKYGNPQRGLKGIFNRDETVTAQYAYTNAPDAEDRAIQGVFDANQWGVGDASVTAKAAEMGDELRNNMYDKYYQEISETKLYSNFSVGSDANCAHYLMNWYTSWGGALASSGQNWCWQIGCSHAHEFYQNPLAAYALITDSGLKSGMKAQGAVDDYTTSLERQMEFYLWLQSANGPIAGGATNSYKGRYEAYPSGASTFHGMMYIEHPVYADPGSNHWFGNQVWAVQRLAELYYWVKTNGDTTGVKPGGLTLEAALEQILDKWCTWFVNNTILTADGDYYMPSNLNLSGQPDKWGGSPSANSGLTCEITGYGQADIGCISSLSNTLIYYAKAKGVKAADISGFSASDFGSAYKSGIDDSSVKAGSKTFTAAETPAASLYLAQQLIDRQWELARDDMGLSRLDHNGSLARVFCQPTFIPKSYTGTMPNGDKLENGATFLSIRTMYEGNAAPNGTSCSAECLAKVEEFKKAYEKDVAAGAKWSGDYSASSEEGKAELAKFTNTADVDLHYHRFWHEGDAMMALGGMAELYGDELTPGSVTPAETTEAPEETTEKPAEDTTEKPAEDTTEKPAEDTTGASDEQGDKSKILWGDADVSGTVDIMDVIATNKFLLGSGTLSAQGKLNADVDESSQVDTTDSLNILKLVVEMLSQSDFPIK